LPIFYLFLDILLVWKMLEKQSQMRDLLYSPSCAEGNFQFSHISIAGCPLRLEKLGNEPFSEFG